MACVRIFGAVGFAGLSVVTWDFIIIAVVVLVREPHGQW